MLLRYRQDYRITASRYNRKMKAAPRLRLVYDKSDTKIGLLCPNRSKFPPPHRSTSCPLPHHLQCQQCYLQPSSATAIRPADTTERQTERQATSRPAPHAEQSPREQEKDDHKTGTSSSPLHKSPEKGQQVIAKITHRQIISSATCAEKMRTLMYDIFMTATGDNYITHQLEKGKQRIYPSQHKHSNGVTPKYAFMTLLLQAAIHTNTVQYQHGLHPVHDLQLTQGRMDHHSIHIHNRLIQIVEDYEQSTRTAALSFNFGQDYQYINQAALEELKRVRSLPWTIKLDEPDHLITTHPQQYRRSPTKP